jgi:hypothetical protein
MIQQVIEFSIKTRFVQSLSQRALPLTFSPFAELNTAHSGNQLKP